MLAGKLLEVLFARRDLSADCIVSREHLRRRKAREHLLAQLLEVLDTLRSLREEEYRSREIYLFEICLTLDDNRRLGNLTRQSDNLGVTPLAENHHLTAHLAHLGMSLHDPLLQLSNHGAGGIYNLDTQFASPLECRGRLSVRSDQQTATRERRQILVRDCTQTQALQALDLDAVVHDITERKDLATLQSPLRLVDSSHHTETETRILVNLYSHRSTL